MSDTLTHTFGDTRHGVPAAGVADDTLVVSVAAVAVGDTVDADETVACPECGKPAVIEWSDTVGSTSGPIEHIKISCADRHWFLMPSFGARRTGLRLSVTKSEVL